MIEGFLGGSKFSSSGFFGVENFGKYFFGLLDLAEMFSRIQNNLKIFDSSQV